MRLVRHDDFIRIELDDLQRLVRVTRTARPFANADDAGRTFGETAGQFPTLNRSEWKLLVDMRSAPGRNDPEFERAVGSLRNAMFDGFARTAMLVATAVGRLQVQRVSKENGGGMPQVFTDQTAALSYLEVTIGSEHESR